MDEPLSNLDAKLRVQMRTEITKLHQRLQTTFIYVTHDQTEALTMGTRIVVMKDGFIQQVDTPQNLYDYPAQPVRRLLHRQPADELLRREARQGARTACGPSSAATPSRCRMRRFASWWTSPGIGKGSCHGHPSGEHPR